MSLPRSFSTRLILSFFILIVLTTISAGIPAYWLARDQAEQQAWSQVDGAQAATRALLAAEEERLVNLATIFAERPTLQQLAQEGDDDTLGAYLAAFQMQSELDLLQFCDAAGQVRVGAGVLEGCRLQEEAAYVLVDGRPALVAYQEVDDARGILLGSTLAGIWLDDTFMARLAAQTGVAQSVIDAGGRRLVSSLPAGVADNATQGSVAEGERRQLLARGAPYYATYLALPGDSGEPVFLAEVALPVAALATTERQALYILAGSTVAVAAFGSLLAIAIVRQLVAPLERLTAVAERIGAGNLVAPIPRIEEPVEVGTLAGALQRSQASMLQALQEHAAARDWLDSLVQSIVEGVVTIDDSGAITFFSQGAERLSGWSRDEALGQPLDVVFPLAGEDGSFGALLARGEKRQIEVRARGGTKMVLAVTGAELATAESGGAQLALVLRDVTEEDAVRHLRAYFLANISHEFLTPLSTLNASMELLLDPDERFSASEMRELLKPSYLSLRALQTLIDNLLESSSIEAGQFAIRLEATDVNQVLAGALQMVAPLLERRRQTVSVSEPGALPAVDGDPARLTQVVVNLLANASKYSPPQSTIDVRVEQLGVVLRVSVADQGPGIPAAERSEVFRRFVRLETKDGEQYGVGLGLYVVKTTVEAHGGRVGIDDRPGGGALVWFELPLPGAEIRA
ncbi:MAG: ATP-binding protein [Anaerolineae bacterium]|nr:ATP-binding protein [Anaerolineae bacterium]